MNEDRIFCPYLPCLPMPLDGMTLNNEIVRESRSFGTFEGYYWHVTAAHFIPKSNARPPLCLEREESSEIPPDFGAQQKAAS